jgi:hypothetical protein
MMSYYPLVLEILVYTLTAYFIYKKKELAIIYLPLLLFITSMTEVFYLRALVRYAIYSGLIFYSAYRVNGISIYNKYALLLLLYFTILFITNSSGFEDARSTYFNMALFLLSIIIIPNIYIKHERENILNEVYKMSFGVLSLFVINTIVSTLTGYAPMRMYGISTGVLYGRLFAAAFNIVPVVLFFYLLYKVKNISLINIIMALLAFSMLLFTMRRGVVLVAFIGMGVVLLYLVWYQKTGHLVVFSYSALIVVIIFFGYTGYYTQIIERFEHRFSDREVVHLEEGRFVDHRLIYEDIFIYRRYSPYIGYEFFNSAGNYADGIYGSRSLHPDIPVIVHATGLIGLLLYLLMIFKIFHQSWLSSFWPEDRFIWIFCLLVFIVFTITGRITSASYAIALVSILMIPMSNLSEQDENENIVL